MLNTECKQCHKKWHHDNANYCTMCGKKLVEEPEFKSGDIVASQVFSDGSFSLVKLNKDLTNRLTPVYGFWYTKRDCDIVEASFGVFEKDTRHATPEEIAEYEAALTFHKHGREPFEVKEGDILVDDEGDIFFVGFPDNFKKEYFTSGHYTFLKTDEEFNEWLGVSDDK